MKKYMFIHILCIAIGGHCLASAAVANQNKANVKKEHDCRSKKSCHKPKKDPCCSCEYVISSRDIKKGKTVVINKPGIWCLDGDAEFKPKISAFAPPDPRAVQAAIRVAPGVSDVTIKLGGFTLSQAGSGTSTQVPFVVGILVPDPAPFNTDTNFVGAESIYIEGDQAIIDGFSMYGVRIFAHTRDLRLSNLTIKNCGVLASLGIRPIVYGFEYLPHTTGNPFPVTPGFGPSFGVGGLVIGESTVLGMGPQFFVDVPSNVMNNVNRTSEVVLENVSCLNNFLCGGMTPSITDYTITNCHFDYNWSNDPGRTTAPAYDVIPAKGLLLTHGINGPADSNGNIDPNCINVLVNNSTFNNTSLRGDFTAVLIGAAFPCGGVGDVRSRNVTWNNCQFNNSSNTFDNLVPASLTSNARVKTGVIVGFSCGGVEDYNFTNCNFDGITSVGTAEGFHISGTTSNAPVKSAKNLRLINCTANNIRSMGDQAKPAPVLSTAIAVGYVLAYVKDIVLDGCTSLNVINTSPVSGASFNSGISPTASSNAGTAEMENIIIRNCVVSRVQALNGGQAYGFNTFCPVITNPTAFNSIRSTVYENCIATGNETFVPPAAEIPLNLPVYSATTNYTRGISVSFSGTNYVAVQANGPATALGVVTPGSNPLVWQVIVTPPTFGNIYDPTVNYLVNNLVIFNGVNYKALAANGPATSNVTTPGTNPAIWSTSTGIVQGAGVGFFTQADDDTESNAPAVFINCVAARNKGVQSMTQFNVPRYSSGFQVFGGNAYIFDSCKATDNVFGFILSGSSTLPAKTQSNRFAIRNCQADNNSVEGFTDTGTGTPASPTQSLSIWEGNHAFANGLNSPAHHVGPNGNYNIWMDAALTIRPPLLQVQSSTGSTSVIPGPNYFANYHNISEVQ